ncbi:DNA polymerase III subunit gamma/tau [Clostridium sp. DL1XJH146]
MAYTALYREWRPKRFDEVVGQEHITRTLKNQVKNDRTAHAYLLCGTRGTGKTSTAKIIAKAVNCLDLQDGEPCNKCEMCTKINAGIAMDVVEMDAASHNKVEHIRDLIDEVKYPPRDGKKKVYILDEAHMLTTGAVNAFLKTLEEPPKYVTFILATTDPQKLPITILSRCQRYDFKRIKNDDIFNRMFNITQSNGVFAEEKALRLIARMSDGAMRDALSILDQSISMGEGKIEYDSVLNMLGFVTNENLLQLTGSVIDKNVEVSMKVVDEIVLGGKDINLFLKEFVQHMRNLLMVKVSNNPEDILDMSKENIEQVKLQAARITVEEIMRYISIIQETESQAKWSNQGRIYLELAVIKMCKIEYDTSNEIILSRLNKLERIIKDGKIQIINDARYNNGNNSREAKDNLNTTGILKDIAEKNSYKRNNKDINSEVTNSKENINSDSKITISDVQKKWMDILELLKARRHMVIYAALTTGKLESCSGGIIEIKYENQYSFNKRRLEKDDNRKIVEDIFSEALKEKVRIKYTIQEDKQENKEDIQNRILEAFGEDFVEIIDE